jgi:serine/threonine-protein kinase RsbW
MPVVLDAGRRDGDASAAVAISLDTRAPGVARRVVAQCLADRVAPSALEIAQLLASELVTNSVRHSGVPEGAAIVVRVHLSTGICRLEVEDPGHEGVIAPRPPDPRRGGMGLNLLATLSESWGVVRAAAGPTRVWAQLPCPPLA